MRPLRICNRRHSDSLRASERRWCRCRGGCVTPLQPTYRFLLLVVVAFMGGLAGTLLLTKLQTPNWYARSFYIGIEEPTTVINTALYTVHWFCYAFIVEGTTLLLMMPDTSRWSLWLALGLTTASATMSATITGVGYFYGSQWYTIADHWWLAVPMIVHCTAVFTSAAGLAYHRAGEPFATSRRWARVHRWLQRAPRPTVLLHALLNVIWLTLTALQIDAENVVDYKLTTPLLFRTAVMAVVLLATVVLEQLYWAWKADGERPFTWCASARRRIGAPRLAAAAAESDAVGHDTAALLGGEGLQMYGTATPQRTSRSPRAVRRESMRALADSGEHSGGRVPVPYDDHERQADAAVPKLAGPVYDALHSTFPPRGPTGSAAPSSTTLYVLSTTDALPEIAPWHAGTWRPTAGGLELVNRSASAALPSHVAAAVGRARNIVEKRYTVVSDTYDIPCAAEHFLLTRLMPDAPSSIVKYLGRVMDASSASLVFELCTYGDLNIMLDAVHRDPSSDVAVRRRRTAIMRQVLPPANRMRMAVQLAEALAHCHARGVVHCDVKPANVFVDGSLGAVLGDFGHSCALDGAPPQGYRGTVVFSAPETCLRWELSPASDVWSLAVTLWCLFALRPRPEWRSGQVRALEGGSTAGERFTSVPDSSVGSADVPPLDGSRGLMQRLEDQGRRLRRGDRPKLPRAARVAAGALGELDVVTIPTPPHPAAVWASPVEPTSTAGSVRRTSDLFPGMDEEAAHAIAVLLCRMWATDPTCRPPAAQVLAQLCHIQSAHFPDEAGGSSCFSFGAGSSWSSAASSALPSGGAGGAASLPGDVAVAVGPVPPDADAAGVGGGGPVTLVATAESGGPGAADSVAVLWGAPAPRSHAAESRRPRGDTPHKRDEVGGVGGGAPPAAGADGSAHRAPRSGAAGRTGRDDRFRRGSSGSESGSPKPPPPASAAGGDLHREPGRGGGGGGGGGGARGGHCSSGGSSGAPGVGLLDEETGGAV
jgi:serine/threonine protein kinase